MTLRSHVRSVHRAKLKEARKKLREAREAKRTASRRAREICKSARRSMKRWRVKAMAMLNRRISLLRAALRAEVTRRKKNVNACCSKERRDQVKAAHDEKISEIQQVIDDTKNAITRTRSYSHVQGALKRKELEQEADHEVEANLTPDEVIVFRRVKKIIKAKPLMSRTEAFQHWAEFNPDKVLRILEEDAQEHVDRMVKEEERRLKDLAKTHGSRDVDLSDIPF